ncbi:hypothetical protein [Alteromonas lipolytica]|uniref:Uncharacterized protein n=1 Tax=Alteromonas lipolytica TaxID=1856405 RepID=A0A1E8FAI7_9ALTE|nr:hypothetical protein [Alteromonas lipolytica]OFI32947.1 hypothetical protein BFC17_01330 [Alteromonas lipolytica]GGF63981.1 hypothetical protein GCM10011338_15420 [Alteromonas lipolytica]
MKCSNLTAKLWLIFIIVFSAFPATSAEYKGVVEYPYSGWLDDDERAAAYAEAKLKAVETWLAKTQQYQLPNFALIKDDISANIDDYLLQSTVISKKENKDDNLFRVVMRVSINESKLLAKLTEAGRGQAAPSNEDQYITFVFVARELASRIEAKDTQSGDFQRGENTWQATTTNEVDSAVGAVFSAANYYVIDAALLEEETEGQLDVNNFIMDYEQGDDLTPATKRDAIRGLRGLLDPVQYLAIGTLDVDEHSTDDVSGLYQVPVSVTAKILAIKRRGAAVASVGPVQYIGLGPTPIVAKNNALKLAAEKMAAGLIGQLSSKSI